MSRAATFGIGTSRAATIGIVMSRAATIGIVMSRAATIGIGLSRAATIGMVMSRANIAQETAVALETELQERKRDLKLINPLYLWKLPLQLLPNRPRYLHYL